MLLLVVPASLLYLLDRKMLRSFGIAVGRMTVQLTILCLLVWLLYRYDRWWLNLLWLMVMSVYSAFMILWRTHQNWRRFLFPISIAQMVGCLVVGSYLLLAVLPAEPAFGARWFVPLMALLLSHSTVTQVRGVNTYHTALKADEQQYEFLRANGTPHLQAVKPFIRRALQSVLAPAVGNLSVMALFTMPLLLVGLLLSGIAPQIALSTTLVLTVGCVATSVVALILGIWLSDRRLFDSFGKLTLLLAILACCGCRGQQSQNAQVKETEPAGFYDSNKAKKATVMYELPAPLKDRQEQILKRLGYTTSYNSLTKTPNWVAWHLTKAHTYGNARRHEEMFSEDGEVGRGRATNNDYYNSRYDRGHMCPAGDNKWDRQAMRESFLFTNICPQNHGLNKYEWNDLEIQCRDWAREYGSIDIVCGPIYNNSSSGPQKTIGRNKVWVPDAFFKVILCRKGSPKAIGFVYRNKGVKQSKQEAVCSVDEIESMTGIDFFPALDDATENKIEAEARLSDW